MLIFKKGRERLEALKLSLNPKLLVIVSSGHVAATHKRDDANE